MAARGARQIALLLVLMCGQALGFRSGSGFHTGGVVSARMYPTLRWVLRSRCCSFWALFVLVVLLRSELCPTAGKGGERPGTSSRSDICSLPLLAGALKLVLQDRYSKTRTLWVTFLSSPEQLCDSTDILAFPRTIVALPEQFCSGNAKLLPPQIGSPRTLGHLERVATNPQPPLLLVISIVTICGGGIYLAVPPATNPPNSRHSSVSNLHD